MLQVLLIVVLVVVVLPVMLYLFWVIHITLARICYWHARRYCKRHNLEIRRARWQPACEESGGKRIKTEFTLIQLDCLNAQKERRLVLLLTWPFGVRKLRSDEIYPEAYDSQWPQEALEPGLPPTKPNPGAS